MPYRVNKTSGRRQALFGGYATFWLDGKRFEREVRVWGPSGLADDDCGRDTDRLVKALTAAVRRMVRRTYVGNLESLEVRESWRY